MGLFDYIDNEIELYRGLDHRLKTLNHVRGLWTFLLSGFVGFSLFMMGLFSEGSEDDRVFLFLFFWICGVFFLLVFPYRHVVTSINRMLVFVAVNILFGALSIYEFWGQTKVSSTGLAENSRNSDIMPYFLLATFSPIFFLLWYRHFKRVSTSNLNSPK
jgi:hypothetical protein